LNPDKTARILLLSGYGICLLQVWLPDYYLTGDGPCHVYNAQILHDLWSGRNAIFYGHFFQVVGSPNPNWMSHLLLAGLLLLFKGVMAEKILLSGYIILFISGFTRLLRRMDAHSAYWQLAAFAFVFHYVLAKGFFNFSFGIAIMFWMTDAWLALLTKRNAGHILGFFLLVCLTFFAHPVAFAFGAACCGTLAWSTVRPRNSSTGRHAYSRRVLGNLLVCSVCLLPCLILLLKFAAGQAHDGGVALHLARYKVLEFPDFNCLVSLTTHEVWPVRGLWALLTCLLVYALVVRLRKGIKWHRFDGLLATMLFALFVYFFFPDKLFGGSLFVVRAQYIWALFSVCSIGYLLPRGKTKNIAGLLFFATFIGLSVMRMKCMAVASSSLNEIMKAEPSILPGSVVLPLDFSPGGRDDKWQVIADRNWLFCHAWQYMGTDKPLILLDNYEANTGYFPLVWKDSTNPYHLFCHNGELESQPPHGSVKSYKNASGSSIDYVLLWCYEDKWLEDEPFNRLYREIKTGYELIYQSETGRVELYKKK